MTEASRARRLGDVGPNDPRVVALGRPRQAAARADADLRAHAGRLDEWERELKDERWQAGFATLTSLSTNDLGDIEPFGFDDGISQPVLDWERQKSERIHDTTAYTNLSALGEVLLGYPNEYGKYTDRPLLDPGDDPDGILPAAEDVPGKKDLGRNGTYLVLRDLSQDAPAFWQFINEQAARDREGRELVAAATVGRVPSAIPSLPGEHGEAGDSSGPSDRAAQRRGDSRRRSGPRGSPSQSVHLSQRCRRRRLSLRRPYPPRQSAQRRSPGRHPGLVGAADPDPGFRPPAFARRPDCVDPVSSHSPPRP